MITVKWKSRSPRELFNKVISRGTLVPVITRVSIIYFSLLATGGETASFARFTELRIWVLADEEPALGVYEANTPGDGLERETLAVGEWIG